MILSGMEGQKVSQSLASLAIDILVIVFIAKQKRE